MAWFSGGRSKPTAKPRTLARIGGAVFLAILCTVLIRLLVSLGTAHSIS